MTERWYKQYRMNWIAESLRVYGFINREHVMRKFGLSTPQASKDLNEFQKQNPGMVSYDLHLKKFIAQPIRKPKYELCDTVFPSGEKCVRPKNHQQWSKAMCSPTPKFMEYSAVSQSEEAKLRTTENKAKTANERTKAK